VAKTANLLTDGLGLGPGDVAAVVLPVHWQALVALAGCWRAGLEVRTSGGPADVSFVAEDWADEAGAVTAAAPAPETLALSLRPLGAGLRTAPEPGTTDYAASVRGFGDRFDGPRPGPDAPALDGRTHRELVHAARGAGTAGMRLLLAPDADRALDVETTLLAYLGPLAAGGSVVLCRHADPGALPRRLAAERAISA